MRAARLLGQQKLAQQEFAGANVGCKTQKTGLFILAGEVSRKEPRIVKNCEQKTAPLPGSDSGAGVPVMAYCWAGGAVEGTSLRGAT